MLLVWAVLRGGGQSGASVFQQHEHLGAFHLKSSLKQPQSFITEMRERTVTILLSHLNMEHDT
jgi:hypothetical protein